MRFKNFRQIVICFSLFLSTTLKSNNSIVIANQKLIDAIMEDLFSPPVASRIHLYPNIAAYEVFCQKQNNYKSLVGQIKHMPDIPKVKNKLVNIEIAAEMAFYMTAKKLVFTEDNIQQQIDARKAYYFSIKIKNDVLNESMQYAKEVSDVIINWSKNDQYIYTRTLARFTPSDSLSSWRPTPPQYVDALEPHWGKIRKLTYENNEFEPVLPVLPYSEDTASAFYKSAYKVYENSIKEFDSTQKLIAQYWDCNPVTSINSGHAMFVVKKPTPGGHWMKIVGFVSNDLKYNAFQSSILYTMTSIAMFEAFIQCWNVKYETNLIRPETYIQRVIDPNWKPFIETPPFPEYTSGHSTVSAAISTILMDLIPQPYAFTDSSQLFINLPARRFKNFDEASMEANLSRFYGGIHYMEGLTNGRIHGKAIGRNILNKIKIKK